MTAPELSARERETLARIESTPAAPESFDATAALRRVLDFADRYKRGDIGDPGRGVVAWMIRVAVYDSANGGES